MAHLMNHVFWLLGRLLAGRPGPVQAPWNPEELLAGGLQAVVSLNAEADPAELEAAGLRHHSLPMPPILPLSVPLKDLMLRGLEPGLVVAHAEVSAGRPTLVHCHGGKDRTGLLLAAYLIRYQGLDFEQAVERVRAVRPIAMSAPGFENTVRRFAEKERQGS
jgi:protein-tyrosine phosphatase